MRREDLGRYQMLWDCPFCSTAKLLGLDHRHCPSCGSPQDPDKRYYPPEGEEIAVADHPFAGADLACPACATPNATAATFCVNCGSPMDEASTVAAKAEDRAQPLAATPEPPKKRSSKKGCVLGCIAVLFLGLIVFCLLMTFWKSEQVVTVTGHSWERTVEVERMGDVTKTAWRDDVPSGSKLGRCTKEERSTKKVKSGEKCETVRKDKGDGTYDKVKECTPTYDEQSVYDEKCSYTVQEWAVVRTEKSNGSSTTDTISWPSVKLASGEREGDREERYVVTFNLSDGESGSCSTSQSRWATLQPQSVWTAEVGVLSDKVDCDELKAR